MSSSCVSRTEALISETRNSAWVSTPRTEQQRGAHTLHAFIPIFNKHEAIILSKKKLRSTDGCKYKCKKHEFERCANFLQTLGEVRLVIRQACNPRLVSGLTKLSAWCCEPLRAEELLAESV